MPTSFSTSYLVPAIILNPIFILHGFNTFASHIIPQAVAATASPNQWLEYFGPVVGTDPYLDIHADEQLCWRYTFLMVFLQVLAFGRVSDNRVRRKSARAAAKAERERLGKSPKGDEKNDVVAHVNGHHHAAPDGETNSQPKKANGHEVNTNGLDILSTRESDEESTLETSEEETIV